MTTGVAEGAKVTTPSVMKNDSSWVGEVWYASVALPPLLTVTSRTSSQNVMLEYSSSAGHAAADCVTVSELPPVPVPEMVVQSWRRLTQ